jgi:hypothetical protein
MMIEKIKNWGFVMTDGGAKGLYEAGVIHAFHISGMEFDVITGSSSESPLQVDQITIHPQEMPMSTLQFTEHLGYRVDNAINMLTMGCYNTPWTLRTYLDKGSYQSDDQDRRVLDLVVKWTGIEDLPEDFRDRDHLQESWACQRTARIYHQQHCPHGAKQ